MYEIKLINLHQQFGKKHFSMLFHDTSEEFPDYRWEKKYPEGVTKAEALSDIKKTLRAYAEEIGITWEDAKANGASITIDNAGGSKTIWEI